MASPCRHNPATGCGSSAAAGTAWVGTTWVADASFGAEPIRSHSYTAPVGQSILYLMTGSAGGLNLGVGSVAGVLAGALLMGPLRGSDGEMLWQGLAVLGFAAGLVGGHRVWRPAAATVVTVVVGLLILGVLR